MGRLVSVSDDTHMSISRPERAPVGASRALKAPNLPRTANFRPRNRDRSVQSWANARLAVIWQKRAAVWGSLHGAPLP